MRFVKTLLLPGGRIGLARFWIIYLASWVPVVALEEIAMTSIVDKAAYERLHWVERFVIAHTLEAIALYFAFFWLYVVATINRLHDRNKSGWLALVPVAPVFFCLAVCGAAVSREGMSGSLYLLFIASVVVAVCSQIWLIVECGLEGRAKGSERYAANSAAGHR